MVISGLHGYENQMSAFGVEGRKENTRHNTFHPCQSFCGHFRLRCNDGSGLIIRRYAGCGKLIFSFLFYLFIIFINIVCFVLFSLPHWIKEIVCYRGSPVYTGVFLDGIPSLVSKVRFAHRDCHRLLDCDDVTP